MAPRPVDPAEIGEWVDPAVPLPDHPFRKTWWWGVFNRAPRPLHWWLVNVIWGGIAYQVIVNHQYPPDPFLLAMIGWTAVLFGYTTYEKRLGIA